MNAWLVVDVNGVPVVGGIVHGSVAVPIPIPRGDVRIARGVRISTVKKHFLSRTNTVRRWNLRIHHRHGNRAGLATVDARCEVSRAGLPAGEHHGQTPCRVGFGRDLDHALQLVAAALRENRREGVVSVVDGDGRRRVQVKHTPLDPNGSVWGRGTNGHKLVFVGAVGACAVSRIHEGVVAAFDEVGARDGDLSLRHNREGRHSPKEHAHAQGEIQRSGAHFNRAWALTM